MKTASPEYLALRDFVFLAKDPRALILDARKLHRRRLLRHPLFPVLHAEDFDGPRALGALAELIGTLEAIALEGGYNGWRRACRKFSSLKDSIDV
jgi:hypothetical protein